MRASRVNCLHQQLRVAASTYVKTPARAQRSTACAFVRVNICSLLLHCCPCMSTVPNTYGGHGVCRAGASAGRDGVAGSADRAGAGAGKAGSAGGAGSAVRVGSAASAVSAGAAGSAVSAGAGRPTVCAGCAGAALAAGDRGAATIRGQGAACDCSVQSVSQHCKHPSSSLPAPCNPNICLPRSILQSLTQTVGMSNWWRRCLGE